MKIAVDAMGGDYAPEEVVLGAIEAVKSYSLDVVLVGDTNKIKEVLNRYGAKDNSHLSIVHASQVIDMGEHPAQAIRKKKDASIVVATQLVKDGACDAVVAPGSTGAAVTAALLGLGRIKGIERPCIATPIPSKKGITVLLDSGANANSKPKHLVEGAIMGSHYAKYILGVDKPTVGLLNIGEEASKGNELAQATYPLLEKLKTISFYGNVEGRDIPKGTVDVVVCDGFVGNVILKFGEGMAMFIIRLVKDTIKSSGFIAKLGALAVYPALRTLKKRLDFTEYGGAPLLGVDGSFIICHGSSKAKAIKNAIRVAGELAQQDVVGHIRKSIEEEEVEQYDSEN
ncbi:MULTISPECIES: phosphate acyltransferase PlsX [Megasphaera]|uniref:Phosphate acyltransferase n=1 Tax=Megasphaera stantonii TaxID=2144175 RepID=A0A346B0R5_9FIRM|nr:MULTISPECIES: phosphate acyltransferase PlsX [Megasphaera]SCI76925.1 Phosphate acyltransferase [uncultured Ruminococcus sp.]AXL21708.1 phosphate acyltransferase PlsX [Megasphaera stantonii]MCU6714320.1 phosphate acyltransferase PlsX [Megasphaera butyrica]SCH49604.1 Phosphate acyltransferase [uncultured Megasphaera sp.]HJE83803.1 phosphate acyltransferase PlsX [Megasphaera stantonii]